ncbi:EcsC family protein [Shimazuella kribbensis]|uniref:EcsC family protein n=1 Tax=Shimazuella kribbensis TaxID=139808 RepID=UPI000421FC7E|nr:EcsC family protein [Shimazuella kribbensis]
MESLQEASKKIKEWEEDQADLWFWEKIGRIPFAILDKITPKIIQKYIGIALDELGSYIQTGGQYLISQDKILRQYANYLSLPSSEVTIEHIPQVPLGLMNQIAKDNKDNHTNFATVQGATTGFGGIFTLAIDIPVVLGTSLKVLQEMAITYGYDPRKKEERIFIVKCLQFASSDFVGKKAILKELTEASDDTEQEAISKLQGWREVIYSYRDNYGWKKLFQMVPIIGMLFGAIINRYTIQDVAEAGEMLYQKRRVLSKLKDFEYKWEDDQTVTERKEDENIDENL